MGRRGASTRGERGSPGSASEAVCGGSRVNTATMGRCPEIPLAVVIEFGVAHSQGTTAMQMERFRSALLAVRGVASLEDHPHGSTVQQGIHGKQYRGTNFWVKSQLLGEAGIEFELTRHGRTIGPSLCQLSFWSRRTTLC